MSDDFAIDLDFSGVERGGGQFKLLDEGNAHLIIDDLIVKPASTFETTGNRVAEIRFTAEGSEAKPRTWITLFPKMEDNWEFRAFLEAATGQDFDGPISVRKKDLIGLHVGAIVTVADHYQGKKDPEGNVLKQNKIESYFRLG